MEARRLSAAEQAELSEVLARECSAFARQHSLDFNAALARLRRENPGFAARLSAAYGGDLSR